MANTIYRDYIDISVTQREIMEYISVWVHKHKKPVSLKKIVEMMQKKDIKEATILHSLVILVRKGYIRKVTTKDKHNKILIVQLRTLPYEWKEIKDIT